MVPGGRIPRPQMGDESGGEPKGTSVPGVAFSGSRHLKLLFEHDLPEFFRGVKIQNFRRTPRRKFGVGAAVLYPAEIRPPGLAGLWRMITCEMQLSKRDGRRHHPPVILHPGCHL